MTALLLIAGVIIALDQLTKWWVIHNIPVDTPRVVIEGFFQLVHWRNTGAAWGMFQGANLILTIVSIATVIAILVFRRSLHIHEPACRLALGLVTGGVIGNLIDRLGHGSVIDFLDFYLGSRHWPAFNVADSAICVGVGIYILASWRADAAARRAATSTDTSSVADH